MKKNAKPQKKRYRAEDSTTVTVSIKKELLAQIDEAAKCENRSRSNYIITNMMRAVARPSGSEH
jgi:metal-responsive CopG/Arc/MetJ family transcriptional regulator